jgi:glyceraldehyde 3-phosphate dehydrogenase
VRIGINGFGRIGRNLMRAVVERGFPLEVAAINDLVPIRTNAHLLKYDSTFGKAPFSIEVAEEALRVEGRPIRVFAEKDPALIPWSEEGVDLVVEATGRFANREAAAQHLRGSVQFVVVSAPCSDADATFVMGVNEQEFDPERHKVVSNASCTTNCIVPMAKVMSESFKLVGGLMTTVHAMTNDQQLLDLAHKDLRRARSAAFNIVPTTTGAARATGLVLPRLKGLLDGHAVRVPVIDGSLTDLVCLLEGRVSVEAVNDAFRAASESKELSGIIEYSEEPLVSSDIVGSRASCVFDASLTLAIPMEVSGAAVTLVKVFGWYDNEWGYSNRLLDLCLVVAGKAGLA